VTHNPKWVGKRESLNLLAFFCQPIHDICSRRKGEGSLKTMSTCLWSHMTGRLNIQQAVQKLTRLQGRVAQMWKQALVTHTAGSVSKDGQM
jgi:hypothetical protein